VGGCSHERHNIGGNHVNNGRNRLAMAIQKMSDQIRDAKKKDPSLDLEKLEAALDITYEDHFEYQKTQSMAHALGKITTDEAHVIYKALGEGYTEANGGWANHTNFPTKLACTKIIEELLKMRLDLARNQ
jgi:hypothetical protein